MEIIKYPARNTWAHIVERPHLADAVYLAKLLLSRFEDRLYAFKMADQCDLLLLPDALDAGKLASQPFLAAKRPMMGDAETVRLVAHMLNQMQRVGTAVEYDGVLSGRQIDFLKFFGKAEHRYARARFFHGAVGKQKLFRAAVDQHHVRQLGKAAAVQRKPGLGALLPLLQAVGKAAADYLRHGGKVVRALHSLDAKIAVGLFVGKPALKDHHTRHA